MLMVLILYPSPSKKRKTRNFVCAFRCFGWQWSSYADCWRYCCFWQDDERPPWRGALLCHYSSGTNCWFTQYYLLNQDALSSMFHWNFSFLPVFLSFGKVTQKWVFVVHYFTVFPNTLLINIALVSRVIVYTYVVRVSFYLFQVDAHVNKVEVLNVLKVKHMFDMFYSHLAMVQEREALWQMYQKITKEKCQGFLLFTAYSLTTQFMVCWRIFQN